MKLSDFPAQKARPGGCFSAQLKKEEAFFSIKSMRKTPPRLWSQIPHICGEEKPYYWAWAPNAPLVSADVNAALVSAAWSSGLVSAAWSVGLWSAA